MSWGTEWDDKKPLSEHPSYKIMQEMGKQAEERLKQDSSVTPELLGVKDDWVTHTSNYIGVDLGSEASRTVYTEIKDGVIIKVRDNKVPTHDPYTNPNSHVYYSCKCGQILDPGTKSFAQLNNAASEAGWKIRFGDQHYEAHCVECGKEVE